MTASRSAIALVFVFAALVAVTSACHSDEEPLSEAEIAIPPGIETLPLEVVVATRLNVRAGPGAEHPVVGKLAQGDEVRVLEVMDGWKRVRPDSGGLEGWAAGEFLRPPTAR
jgi:uncharacterized protein YgiM (DUF1202 family)